MLHRSIFRLALMLSALGVSSCGIPARSAAVPQPASSQAHRETAQVTSGQPSGPVDVAPSPAVAGEDHLYIRQGAGSVEDRLMVLDSADGTTERELPVGLPAPDWSVLYTVESMNGKTVVRAIDAASGRSLREMTLDGEYTLLATTLDGTLGGLSPNGRWLALAAVPALSEPFAYAQRPRPQSRFAVLDTALTQPARTLVLDGNFSFDALSNSGQALYLIEHLPPEWPDQYQVRRYDLQAAALDTRIIADKRRAPQLMEGTRHAMIASRDGAWLYSVYLNPHHGPFIHALNLNDAFAFCIFLPPQSKDNWEKQRFWAIMMSEDGALYAVNGALGIVAEVDLSQVSIHRSTTLPTSLATNPSGHRTHPAAHNPQAAEMAMGGAALSSDGETLWAAGATGLLAINTADFSLRGQYLEDWTFDSLAMSEDGDRLYAVDMERNTLVQIDAGSGTITGELPGAYGAAHLLWIETQR